MICLNCYSKFNAPKTVHTTYESYYGIDENTRTPLTLEVCPYCGSDEIKEEIDEWKK